MRPRGGAFVGAGLLVLAACVSPPPVAVGTPFGDVRAASRPEADALAERFVELRPRVLAALPGGVGRPTDVWLDPSLRDGELASERGVAAVSNLAAGRIRLGGTPVGLDLDFLLAHELVHVFMGPEWAPLPAVMKEGLCDALACLLVPEDAGRARALRMFGARFAFGDQEFVLAQTDPTFGVRRGARIRVAAPPFERRDPLTALAEGGHGVRLHDDREDEDVLYGYGLLLVERSISRIGIEGLHALCRRAADEGQARVPTAWLLWAADLDSTAASWERALAEAIGPAELSALTGWLAEPLADAIVSEARLRLADLDAEDWLARARIALGLRGADLELPLASLPELRAAVVRAWDAARPAPLHPGEEAWRRERTGAWQGVATALEGEGPGFGIEFASGPPGITLGGRAPAGFAAGASGVAGSAAHVDVSVRFGVDARGAWVSSSLPDGFADFRVLVHGVEVADLGWDLNVEPSTDARGWTTLTARLDSALDLTAAVLFDPEPNVILVQRAGEAPGEQRVPLRIPLRR